MCTRDRYSILNKYLGVDWDQLSKFVNIRSDIALAPTMQMQEEDVSLDSIKSTSTFADSIPLVL